MLDKASPSQQGTAPSLRCACETPQLAAGEVIWVLPPRLCTKAMGRACREEGRCQGSSAPGGCRHEWEGVLTTLFMSPDSICPTKVSSLVSLAASPADGDPGG